MKDKEKKIGPNYKWRSPTIVDKSPEFLDYLRTNPLYEEALYIRKGLLRKIERKRIEAEHIAKNNIKPRTSISLFDLKEPRHLRLVE